jgi:hypothetical protein
MQARTRRVSVEFARRVLLVALERIASTPKLWRYIALLLA